MLQGSQLSKHLEHLDQNPIVLRINQNPIKLRRQGKIRPRIFGSQLAENSNHGGNNQRIGTLEILNQALETNPNCVGVLIENPQNDGDSLLPDENLSGGEQLENLGRQIAREVESGNSRQQIESEAYLELVGGGEVLAELVGDE